MIKGKGMILFTAIFAVAAMAATAWAQGAIDLPQNRPDNKL
jgi:hypothetical protein